MPSDLTERLDAVGDALHDCAMPVGREGAWIGPDTLLNLLAPLGAP